MKKKLLFLIIITVVIIISLLSLNLFAGVKDGIIRDEDPGLYTKNGPYSYDSYTLSRLKTPGGATVYYPTGTEAPYSAVVFCPPYTGTQIMYKAWGPFYASHGIILVTMDTTTTMDSVDSRASQQAKVLDALKKENEDSSSPIYKKVATDRLGAMGWSMGGGATWINSAEYDGLKTAVSLAGHNLSSIDSNSKGRNTKCPTLILNGALDTTYLGGLGQSTGVYNKIPDGVPKVIYEVATAGHMTWGSPTQASDNVAEITLAFQKTFLDGDERWAEYITKPSSNVATWKTSNLDALD